MLKKYLRIGKTELAKRCQLLGLSLATNLFSFDLGTNMKDQVSNLKLSIKSYPCFICRKTNDVARWRLRCMVRVHLLRENFRIEQCSANCSN